MHRTETTDRIVQQLQQLAAAHSQAVTLLSQIVSALGDDLGLDVKSITTTHEAATGPAEAPLHKPSPIADPNTLAIHWRGKTCFLGKTLAFKLFERLSRRPNHFISHAVLLDEVWQCHVTKEAVRSGVKALKHKLRAAGMEDLASAIDGSRRECYGLMLMRVN